MTGIFRRMGEAGGTPLYKNGWSPVALVRAHAKQFLTQLPLSRPNGWHSHGKQLFTPAPAMLAQSVEEALCIVIDAGLDNRPAST